MSRPVILLTGAAGQVGFELAQLLSAHGDVQAFDRATLDLADADALAAAVRGLRPQLIVNAGAYTAVDGAETDANAAFAVNARAPGILAEEARALGAVLIHYSTDYVFDGTSNVPYDESATPHPLNVYGASKLEGERAIAASGAHALVFRTSWVYGARGRNFLLTIRRLARERDELRVVDDQTGVPNWCRMIAETTAGIAGRGLPWMAERAGLYHLSCSGATTWFGFARAILGDTERPRVVPITTLEHPAPARRPAYGVLANAKFEQTFGYKMSDWHLGLKACLAGIIPDSRPID
jgi:dTDP-4-dehydrorhamnose reductase